MSIRSSSPEELKTDCRPFRGGIPCRPHKQHGVHSVDNAGRDCVHYEQRIGRILIITIGLDKEIFRFNNPFYRPEYELYGLREILEPEFNRPCHFSPVCPNDCTQYIHVERVLETCMRLLRE